MLSELKSYRNWVAYQLQENLDGRLTKVPYSPITGRGAMANNAATWGSYDEAVNFAKKQAEISGRQFGRDWGVGFEFGNSPFAGIDLDHCIDDNCNLADWAADIVATMNSYTEYSPSGYGLHIIFKGEILKELSDTGRQGVRVGNIELYYGAHYFTVTEKPYGKVRRVIEASEGIQKIFRKYLLKEPIKNSNMSYSRPLSVEVSNNSKGDLLEIMFNNPKNGDDIRRLYNGDTSNYKSASEADLALCSHLAFYTGNNAFEIDRLFRASKLMRDKWNEKHGAKTYGEMTITKAINGTTNSYKVERQNIEQPQEEQPIDFEREAVAYYLNDFLQEIKRNREGQAISTGFENLDKIFDGGLYPGLYFIGANSSLGKTTLILQIGDNIAKSGRGVLVFSLEMSRSELIAKSLSRMSLLKSLEIYKHTKYAKTTRGILIGKYSDVEGDLISQSLREYAEFGQNLHISEGLGNVGVKQVKDKILQYIDHKGTPPVVVIDYIQILNPYDLKMTDKQNVDKNVLELKRLSRDFQMPVIGISSFNRENYRTPVSMASFKESGAIEYSSDVLLGAQYDGWDYKDKEKESDRLFRLHLIREDMDRRAKNGEPQIIQLKILKNRNGTRGSAYFEFFSKFNYFRPCEPVYGEQKK